MNTSAGAELTIPVQTPPGDGGARWVWSQHWLDLLFLHWRTPVTALRPLVPSGLEIQTYEGTAWVSLVCFRLRVRPRWLPFLPGLSNLVEVNLRTYVCCHDKPGIYFVHMWADNRRAICLARWLTPLPYSHARLRYDRSDQDFRFQGHDLGSPRSAVSIAFQPVGEPQKAGGNALDAWLLERYRLYVDDRKGNLLQAEVAHPPWVIRDVGFSVAVHPLAWRGLELSRPPDAAHYAAGVCSRFSGFHT